MLCTIIANEEISKLSEKCGNTAKVLNDDMI